MTTWEPRDRDAAPKQGATSPRPRAPKAPLIAGLDLPTVRVPFAVAMMGLLAVGMLGILALNVHIQNQAFALRASQKEESALALQVSELQTQVYAKSAPGALAAAASQLGMVINPYPNFIDLRTGAVTGKKAADGSVPGLEINPELSGQTSPAGSLPQQTVSPAPSTDAPSSTIAPAASTTPAATEPTPSPSVRPNQTKTTQTPKATPTAAPTSRPAATKAAPAKSTPTAGA